ncbi:MAG: hypothetical protein U0791_15160 [Gemmataceae bacterium]
MIGRLTLRIVEWSIGLVGLYFFLRMRVTLPDVAAEKAVEADHRDEVNPIGFPCGFDFVLAISGFGKDAARTIMTMAACSRWAWPCPVCRSFRGYRADGSAEPACCEPIVAVDGEACEGGNHDEALQRYRCNQSRHWRHMVVGGR